MKRPAIKQAERAKPRAHKSSHQTRGASEPPISDRSPRPDTRAAVTRSSSSNRDQQHVALRVEVAERRHEHRNHRHQNPPQQRKPAIRASQPQRSQTGTSRWFTTWTQPVCQPSPRVTAIASPRLGHEPDTRKRAGGCKGAGWSPSPPVNRKRNDTEVRYSRTSTRSSTK